VDQDGQGRVLLLVPGRRLAGDVAAGGGEDVEAEGGQAGGAGPGDLFEGTGGAPAGQDGTRPPPGSGAASQSAGRAVVSSGVPKTRPVSMALMTAAVNSVVGAEPPRSRAAVPAAIVSAGPSRDLRDGVELLFAVPGGEPLEEHALEGSSPGVGDVPPGDVGGGAVRRLGHGGGGGGVDGQGGAQEPETTPARSKATRATRSVASRVVMPSMIAVAGLGMNSPVHAKVLRSA
jgi:hypothetical protein